MSTFDWRERTSPSCQADFDQLFDQAIEFAATQLCENNATPIFAIVRRDSGNDEVYVADGEVASTVQHFGALISQESDTVQSSVVCSEIEVSPGEPRQLVFRLDNRELAIQIIQGFEVPNSTTFNLLDDIEAGIADRLVEFN